VGGKRVVVRIFVLGDTPLGLSPLVCCVRDSISHDSENLKGLKVTAGGEGRQVEAVAMPVVVVEAAAVAVVVAAALILVQVVVEEAVVDVAVVVIVDVVEAGTAAVAVVVRVTQVEIVYEVVACCTIYVVAEVREDVVVASCWSWVAQKYNTYFLLPLFFARWRKEFVWWSAVKAPSVVEVVVNVASAVEASVVVLAVVAVVGAVGAVAVELAPFVGAVAVELAPFAAAVESFHAAAAREKLNRKVVLCVVAAAVADASSLGTQTGT
jgi:hypothetical protein